MSRILVIDDEEEIRDIVKYHLGKAGHTVIEAENGEKAIEKINQADNRLEVDAVICDMRMPKINGVEAISYFKKDYPNLPIIVITGFPDINMATGLMENKGVVSYLVKPVEKQTLIDVVNKAIAGRKRGIVEDTPRE